MSAAPDPFDLARAEAMLHGYDARWSDERYEVIGVEVEFRAPLINPETGAASRTFQRGGKIDVIVREVDDAKRTLLVEHKNVTQDIRPGSPYWRVLLMDGQISTYFAGAEALGIPVDGCLYDVLGKPALHPYKATPEDKRKFKADGSLYANQRERDETPEEFFSRCVEAIASDPEGYYRRQDIVRLDGEVRDAQWDDWQMAVQLREAQRAGRFPRNPDACMKWGRACEFFDVCTGMGALDDPIKFRRSTVVSPELRQDEPGALPVLSNSRLKAARACQRLHRLRYLEGYRPLVEADALRFGSLMHLGLEAWWSEPDPEKRLRAAVDAVRNPQVEV